MIVISDAPTPAPPQYERVTLIPRSTAGWRYRFGQVSNEESEGYKWAGIRQRLFFVFFQLIVSSNVSYEYF